MRMEVGIFAGESLMLNEVITGIEGQMPEVSINVYADEEKVPVLQSEVPSAQIDELNKFGDEDVLLVLPGGDSLAGNAGDFDGSVIDAAGYYSEDADICKVLNPVEYILNSVCDDIDEIKGVCSLPAAIFGKDGVDDLINQTRHLLAFSDYNSKVIDFNLGFNVATEGNPLFDKYLTNIKDEVRKNFIFRLLPVSTGLILDICGNTEDVAGEDLYGKTGNLTDIIANEGLVFRKENNGMVTVYGDYLHIFTKQILDELKKL
ncbi:MAG TPA: hypothetical protein DHM44_05210 [Flexistipes sinusarabici]|uniref:Uncharacterized protein n=1 Tax=Flexistipes sinusarabici TaxID=2352 RepID=A0A3D5QB47_FLESI|nr:hypothetical protein [Flexistipes sinusarabici]